MKNLESSYEKNIGTPKGTTATERVIVSGQYRGCV